MSPRAFVAFLLVGAALPGRARADGIAEAQRRLDEGVALYRVGRLAEAREALTRARDLVPDKPNPYRLLGLVEARLGHCVEAVADLDVFLARLKRVPEPEKDARIAEVMDVRERCRRKLPPAPPSAPTALAESLDEPPGPAANEPTAPPVTAPAPEAPPAVPASEALAAPSPLPSPALSPVPPAVPATASAVPSPSKPSTAEPARSGARRSRWVWGLAGVGAAVAVGAITLGVAFGTARDPVPSDGTIMVP